MKRIGCWFDSGLVNFRLYATKAETVQIHFLSQARIMEMQPEGEGYWFCSDESFVAGDRYLFSVNHQNAFPDPASRYQPEGVHGPSMGVDTGTFHWTHPNPKFIYPSSRVIYELHIGAFTKEGTFQAAAEKIEYLQQLGITIIELMPLSAFPGKRGWGYDGVFPYAPFQGYGSPQDLVSFIDKAHEHGIAVLLDVVYNHLGPDGNYTGIYSDDYLNPIHQTPWGDALNFDGRNNFALRNFFLENVTYWLGEYRFDGLRFDATHAICDDSPTHFLAEISSAVKEKFPERNVLLYAEDHRNPAYFCKDISHGGFGLDGVWADDLHHHLRRHTAGDNEGYFAPFEGSIAQICETLEKGWFRDGSSSEGIQSEGTDPKELDYSKFVVCIQNHDQIGNRAFGDRIHHGMDIQVYKALTALLLYAPETPLVFMGQEWACTSPFQFFTDHSTELGVMVTEGRRREFQGFKAFSEPHNREKIPDPQSEKTYDNSRLNWDEMNASYHKVIYSTYQQLLRLRTSHPSFESVARESFRACPLSEHSLAMQRSNGISKSICVVCLNPVGETLPLNRVTDNNSILRPLFMNTEVERDRNTDCIRFSGAGAVIFEIVEPNRSLK